MCVSFYLITCFGYDLNTFIITNALLKLLEGLEGFITTYRYHIVMKYKDSNYYGSISSLITQRYYNMEQCT